MNIAGYKIDIPRGLPQNGDALIRSVGNVISLLLTIGIILSLAFLIWGGLMWIMSEGDKTKVDAARNTIIYAIAGIAIMFLSIFVIQFLGSIFGNPTLFVTPSEAPRQINPGNCIGAECNVR